MRVAVFGLGYVGVVTAACLSRDGHEVFGVDVNQGKVEEIRAGLSPIIEPGLQHLLQQGVAKGLIRTTTDPSEAVPWADVVLICVGTPSQDDGAVNLSHVRTVALQVAELAAPSGDLTLVLRSTSPPGTLRQLTSEIGAAHPGLRVHSAMNPEFLREGTAVLDFDDPPFIVIGTEDDVAEAAVRDLYATVLAPVYITDPEVAETVKYAANSWHALKICFANEIGRIAKSHDVDGRDVMGILVEDSKLNVSKAYMRPGFAYGGSCLPKDVDALLAVGRDRNVQLPLLSSLGPSNKRQVEEAVAMILETGARVVAVLGLAFKPGTDDLRESPSVTLVKRLIGEGIEVRIFDAAINEARLVGTNLAFMQKNLPHFENRLVSDFAEAVDGATAVVLAHASNDIRESVIRLDDGPTVIDLNGAFEKRRTGGDYVGLAW